MATRPAVSPTPPQNITNPHEQVSVLSHTPNGMVSRSDRVAVEEPLEIRLSFESAGVRKEKTISITMRTPGDDFDLAAGFLFTEGILRARDQIVDIRHCGRPPVGPSTQNVVRVDLTPNANVDLARLERHFYTSSSCGVCGKTSIEALQTAASISFPEGPVIDSGLIPSLPYTLRDAQVVFEQTGGLHAAALFDAAGSLLRVREDVGRHNAVDKIAGSFFLENEVPLHSRILLVSGRASFELVQKAAMAGIPILAAVGAPSSLAISLASELGMTLIGFVRDDRFNIYCGESRVSS